MQPSILRIIVPALILWAGIACGAGAQTLDQAKKMYNEGRYEEAKPVFDRFLAQSPTNASYNLWYGVCCYETGDLEAAEHHLLMANQRKAPESYRYLADLYTRTYRFDEAADMLRGHMALMKKKRIDMAPLEVLLR